MTLVDRCETCPTKLTSVIEKITGQCKSCATKAFYQASKGKIRLTEKDFKKGQFIGAGDTTRALKLKKEIEEGLLVLTFEEDLETGLICQDSVSAKITDKTGFVTRKHLNVEEEILLPWQYSEKDFDAQVPRHRSVSEHDLEIEV